MIIIIDKNIDVDNNIEIHVDMNIDMHINMDKQIGQQASGRGDRLSIIISMIIFLIYFSQPSQHSYRHLTRTHFLVFSVPLVPSFILLIQPTEYSTSCCAVIHLLSIPLSSLTLTTSVCVCLYVCVSDIHTYIHTSTHAYTRTYTHTEVVRVREERGTERR